MESFHFGEENIEDERKLSAEHAKELEEQYPDIESIVDDYRQGMVTEGMLAMRFPNEEDQKEVLRIAEERKSKKL